MGHFSMSISTTDSRLRSVPHRKHSRASDTTVRATIDLSESGTYDCAVEILGAYRLTGNFCRALQIVLDDLGVLHQVEYEIARKSLTDCRHVEFRAGSDVGAGRFNEIINAIKGRVGFDPSLRLWARLFG